VSRLRALLIATAMGLGAILVVGSPAHADPYSCRWQDTGNGGWAHCANGTGTYRVVMVCDVNNGYDYFWAGPVVSVGTYSRADCGANDAKNVGLQVI
jgi:hypothetical protein